MLITTVTRMYVNNTEYSVGNEITLRIQIGEGQKVRMGNIRSIQKDRLVIETVKHRRVIRFEDIIEVL